MAERGTVQLQMNAHKEGVVVYPKNYYDGDYLLHKDFLCDWRGHLWTLGEQAFSDFKGDTNFIHPETPPTKFTPLKARYCVTVWCSSTGTIDVPEWFPLAPIKLRIDLIRDWTRALEAEIRRVEATCPY